LADVSLNKQLVSGKFDYICCPTITTSASSKPISHCKMCTHKTETQISLHPHVRLKSLFGIHADLSSLQLSELQTIYLSGVWQTFQS